MTARLARLYAIVGCIAALSGAVGAITLRIVDPVPIVANTFGFGDLALVGFEFMGVMFALVGALLVVRLPDNAVGWCMVLIGVGHALAGLTGAVTCSAVADGPAGAATAGFAGWLTVLFTMIGGIVFGLGFIFPTGRGHTPAWDRLVRVGAVTYPILTVLLFLIRPGPLQVFASIDNPFGFGPDFRSTLGPQISALIGATSGLFVPVLALSLASRYRTSDTVGRQQLKWFVLALLVALGGIAVAGIGALAADEPPEAGLVMFGFAGALVPIAIGVAILRHHLYDIDRLISRTLGYAAVSGVLAAVFVIAILVIGAVLGSVGQGQTFAVAGSTLLVFALAGPVRRRAQDLIDRRFDRSRYDAERIAGSLAARLRDDVDLDRVESDILDVVAQTLHPMRAGVWLRRSIGVRADQRS